MPVRTSPPIHEIGEAHVVVRREHLGRRVHRSLGVWSLEQVLTVAGLGDFNRTARQHELLEIVHFDVGHCWHVFVEEQCHLAAVLAATVDGHLLRGERGVCHHS